MSIFKKIDVPYLGPPPQRRFFPQAKGEGVQKEKTPEVSKTATSGNVNLGNMAELVDLMTKAGINFTVTSGIRNPGEHGKAGDKSWHTRDGGWAVDIVPTGSETYASMKDKIKNNEELKKYMKDNGLGIIDETDPETKKKTGATGDHWHIGKDKYGQDWFNQNILSNKYGGILKRK